MMLVQVYAPHFTAGFISSGTMTVAGRVTRTAPILQFMAGWPDHEAREYLRSKGWRTAIVWVREEASTA